MSNTIYCEPGQLCPVPAGTGPATACPRSLAGTDACCEVGRPNTCTGQSGTCPTNNHNFVWTKCPSVKCPANGVCPGGRVPDPNSCEKKFNCSQETKCCGFGKDGKGCDPSITTEDQCNALCSSNGRENCWHDPGSKPGPPGQDNCYGRGTCVRFDAQGGCKGCANPCDKEGYAGFFCGECKGGYACIDPNGDRVDSPDCLPPNKCELDNGPRWCDYSGGVCRIPDRGMSANFDTKVDCERECKALNDTKFSCTENGCVISDDGPFRATHRNPNNGTYYSEECESNCKFGKGKPDYSGGMSRTFFENKESTLWDKPDNYGCATFPCTKKEIDALKWVRMPSLKQWHDDEGSTLCRPVSDKMMEDKTKYPVGTPTYENPLDCHNAFGNAGFWCYLEGGFCRMGESKHVGSTLESCHKRCTADGDPTDYWIWNGEECVKTSPDTPDAYHRLENCLDNNAKYSCTDADGNYTCEPTIDGDYDRPTMARSDCAADCHP